MAIVVLVLYWRFELLSRLRLDTLVWISIVQLFVMIDKLEQTGRGMQPFSIKFAR
jgi:hypothetical protein